MSNHLKKHRFSLGIRRVFTRGDMGAYDLIHFREQDHMGDEVTPALECPDNWSAEAAEILAEQAAAKSIPAATRAIEENTVPSWLWRHVAEGKSASAETSVQQIFDRIVGAATYNGWKQDVFAGEAEARSFYEELRYALAQRFVALEPSTLAALGMDWAYGLKSKAMTTKTKAPAATEITNSTIDAIVSGSMEKTARGKWQKAIASKKSTTPVRLHFADIAADWNVGAQQGKPAILDLLAFRHNDGSVNIEALQHVTRLIVTLLDLHGFEAFAIGFANLAPLLTALTIPYDSEAGRAIAAAIASVITAEAYAVSAELAALRGPSSTYTNNRDAILRTLRNHRRATYGDRNDYEKISVLPIPLSLDKCPDLTLAAAAQRRWDEALELVREHGLRATQVTGLYALPSLALFMESATQGIEPLRTLIEQRESNRTVAPYVTEALSQLGYDRSAAHAIISHVAGTLTLDKAPLINHISLRARGFDAAAIERIEEYLPQANDIRLAFTQWVVGEAFCRKVLKIPAAKLQNPAFNLLQYLGFNAAAIAAANTYCYGGDSMRDAKDLRPKHAAIFVRSNEISAEAHIRMAAAVQSFVSGEVELDVTLPQSIPAEKSEKLLLGAWQQGLKSLNLSFDDQAPALSVAEEKKARTKQVTAFLHTRKPSLPARQSKMKATRSLVSKPSHAKTIHKGRTK